MNKPRSWEFQLPHDVGVQKKLEEKRKEYWNRMKTPDPQSGWTSWQQCDLTCRHDSDPGFRLLYYKFIIITDICLACEKHESRKKAGNNGLPDTIEGRMVEMELSSSLGRTVVSDEFDSACEVIHGYLNNPESLN